MNGKGVEQNIDKAVELYEKAAKDPPRDKHGNRNVGVSNAEHSLAQCYYKGFGKALNYPEAFKWYTKSFEHGCATAGYNLALLYWDGLGVEKNQERAMQYLKFAAGRGKYL